MLLPRPQDDLTRLASAFSPRCPGILLLLWASVGFLLAARILQLRGFSWGGKRGQIIYDEQPKKRKLCTGQAPGKSDSMSTIFRDISLHVPGTGTGYRGTPRTNPKRLRVNLPGTRVPGIGTRYLLLRQCPYPVPVLFEPIYI